MAKIHEINSTNPKMSLVWLWNLFSYLEFEFGISFVWQVLANKRNLVLALVD